jgi:Arc/MetJ-type ribon-helix-helix transcriptional regulator
MGQTHNLNITLSVAAAEFVRDKVSSGEYESESDVINNCLEVFKLDAEHQRWEREVLSPAIEAERERWLREVGGSRYDSFQADPSNHLSLEEVEKHLEDRRQQRSKARV